MPKTIFVTMLLFFIIFSLQSSPSYTENISENDFQTIIRDVLNIVSFDYNLLTTPIYNLIIIIGGNETRLMLQNYINQENRPYNEQDFSKSQILTSYTYSEDDVTFGDSFQKILQSCEQRNHTELKCVLIILPENQNLAVEIFSRISWFYEEHPSCPSSIYFFIVYPLSTIAIKDDAETNYLSTPAISVVDILTASAPNAPITGHLYIVSHGGRENNVGENPWTVSEYYNVNGKKVFHPVVVSDGQSRFSTFVRRRADFRGTTLRVLAQHDKVLNVSQEFQFVNGSIVLVGGTSLDFFEAMKISLNFRIEIIYGTGWIGLDSNGSLTGMGKQLKENEADVLLSFSEMLDYRIQQLDFSHPSIVYKVNAYFQKPPQGLSRDIFTDAFSTRLWVVMVAMWILMVACFKVISSVIMKKNYLTEDKYQDQDCRESNDVIGKEAFTWAVAMTCQQGWHSTPKSLSLQIVFICGLFASLLYYTAYSSSIISMFSVEVNRCHTLDDLLKYGFKLYGNAITLSGHHHVKDQADKDGVSFTSRIINATHALQIIQNSRSAYISAQIHFFVSAVHQNNSRSEFCKYLSKSTEFVGRQFSCTYLRKYNPITKFIKFNLNRIRETGISFRCDSNHARRSPQPCEPKRKEPVPLELLDIRSAFAIIAIGFIFCLCILIAEILIYSTHGCGWR